MSAPLTLKLQCTSVAYQAKTGLVDPEDVDTMVALAQELLPSDDPLHRAATGFATQFQVSARDKDALAMQGRILLEHVENDGRPPVSERADLD